MNKQKAHQKVSKATRSPKRGSRWHTAQHYIQKRPQWQRVLIYLVSTLLLLFVIHSVIERVLPEVKNPRYGVSFSAKYAKELGVDWKANFIALNQDMGIRRYRLMSYWDDIEKTQGTYDFSELDWQMDQAATYGSKVSLGLGMRQPRWPECHQPQWFDTLPSKEARDQAIITFVQAVVARYKDHPALESYQLENEAVNNWFGTCTPEDIDQKRLEKEFAAVKALDSNTPLYMSLSDQHGLPLGKPVPDQYGFSVYRIVWNAKTKPFEFYLTYPTPVWYHRLRAWWIQTFKHRDIFIHELQVEPWGPDATVNLSIAEQNRSMSPKQIKENIRFARKIGKPDIYTWGGEWWYWRKEKLGDPSIWNAVKAELNRP